MHTLKAQAIKLLICDVDGIFTDGLLYYGNEGTEVKAFHVHDGLGIKLLQRIGIQVAIISAKTSSALKKRIEDLAIQHSYLAQENKLLAYDALKKLLQLNDNEIAFMGDDLPDLPLITRAGLAVTVPEAPKIIQEKAHYITKKSAGFGAVREVCDLIIAAQNQTEQVLKSFLF